MRYSDKSIQRLQSSAIHGIGQTLAQTRDQLGRGYREMAIKSQIPVHQLQALETGNLGQLPTPIEIQQLIRQYANALGLNGGRLANAFPLTVAPPAPGWQWGTKRIQFRPSTQQKYGAYILLTIGLIQGLSIVLSPAEQSFPTLPNRADHTPESATMSAQSPE